MTHATPNDQATSQAVHRLVEAGVAMWHQVTAMVMTQPVLRWALISMALVLVGGKVRGALPTLGAMMRFLGNLGLITALLATVLGLVDLSSLGVTTPIPDEIRKLIPSTTSAPDQVVEGNTTRIPLADDGHFWVKAKVNGVPKRFLVDTGATLTTLSPDTADDAAVEPSPSGGKVQLKTANGTAEGELANIAELRVGNVVARHIDAVVAPGLGETNVLGMNFLTRLASWRVEGNTMVMVPHHPK